MISVVEPRRAYEHPELAQETDCRRVAARYRGARRGHASACNFLAQRGDGRRINNRYFFGWQRLRVHYDFHSRDDSFLLAGAVLSDAIIRVCVNFQTSRSTHERGRIPDGAWR